MRYNTNILFKTLILITIFTLFPFINNAQAASFTVKERTITVPEKVLIKAEELAEESMIIPLFNQNQTLEGLVDHVETFYDIPVQEKTGNSVLHLKIEYSDLLKKSSTITVLIDENPVKSFALKAGEEKMDLTIPLEGEAMTKGFHTLSIAFYGHISEELCTNTENPANWLTVLSGSHISAESTENIERIAVLKDYPYPFIQTSKDTTVKSAIVIPDHPSSTLLSGALQLANYLSRQALDGEQIPIVMESDVKDISTHLIAVGAADQWQGIIKDLYASTKLSASEDAILISNYFVKAKDTVKQIMFVTSENDAVIEKNIAILTEDNFVEQLSGDELTLKKLPELPKEEMKQKHTFKDLLIPTQTLTGRGSTSAQYFYELPVYMDVNKATSLHLKLNVSERLFNEMNEAELVVFLNDVPHSVAIDDLEAIEADGFYEVELPIEPSILQEESYLTVQFQAHGLNDHEICVPPDNEKWIYLDEDSYLQISIKEQEDDYTFKTWPAPFYSFNGLEDTTVIMPGEPDQQLINEMLILTETLGKQNSLHGLSIMYDENVKVEELKDRHVIILGGLTEHPSLDAFKDKLLFSVNENNQFDVTPFGFLQETAKQVAWIQPSVWNENKSMVILSHVDQGEEPKVTRQLINYLQSTSLMTDSVVQNKNGAIFSHEIVSKDAANQTPIQEDGLLDESFVSMWMIISFIALFILGILLLIVLSKKRKKRSNVKDNLSEETED